MRLSDIVVTSENAKTQMVAYDEKANVYFEMAFLPKSELQKITHLNTRMKPNPKTHNMEEELDAEKVGKEIRQRCVKGWKGMTYRWLSNHIVIDLNKIEDPDAELEFSAENLEDLTKEMYGIDSWLFDAVKSAANFQTKVDEAELKN